MDDAINRAGQALRAAHIECYCNEPLKSHTTFRIGGPAALFCEPANEEQVQQAVSIAKDNLLPFYFLGRGSNVLFCDEGYRGMVIHLAALSGLSVEGEFITAGAGVNLEAVCEAAAAHSLSGLEFAFGIPGSVGGAVYMNAGAFDGEIRNVLHSVVCLNENDKPVVLPAKELELEYRASIFQQKKWCVLSATFALRRGEKVSIRAKMDDYMHRRASRQPLDMPSAGSAFKRPPGAFAAALIDQSGLRGFRIGDAAISEKHCGFVVNHGNATCRDVLMLAEAVVRAVKEKTGYVLEKEIRVITEDSK